LSAASSHILAAVLHSATPHAPTNAEQIDGSVRCACINAASMALICAGLEMRDMVCACSSGILDATIVADVTQSEENA
jgi:ribonuclease PH